MTRALALLALSLPSVACFIGAAVVAYRRTSGWGWLIVAGILVCPIMNPNAAERLTNLLSGEQP
jgi:hypothetical protein